MRALHSGHSVTQALLTTPHRIDVAKRTGSQDRHLYSGPTADRYDLQRACIIASVALCTVLIAGPPVLTLPPVPPTITCRIANSKRVTVLGKVSRAYVMRLRNRSTLHFLPRPEVRRHVVGCISCHDDSVDGDLCHPLQTRDPKWDIPLLAVWIRVMRAHDITLPSSFAPFFESSTYHEHEK